MALQVDHAGFGGLGHEALLQVLVGQTEHDVHIRAAGLVDRAGVPAPAAVDGPVQDRRPLGSPPLELAQAAFGLHPLQDFAHDVDGKHGGRVGHRVVGLVRRVVEVGGEAATVAGQAVLPNYDDSHAGRAEVLLGAAVHQVVGVPVDSPTQEIGAHVGH